MSDVILTAEDFANGYTVMYPNGLSGFESAAGVIFEEDGMGTITRVGAPLGMIIPYDNYADGKVAESGLYFFYYNSGDYYSGITIHGYTGFPTIKPVPVEYIPEHSHNWSDIADRPFYEASTGGDTLTWDGDSTGKVTVDLGEDTLAVKVSDFIPTKADLVNGVREAIAFPESPVPQYFEIPWDQLEGTVGEDGLVMFNASLIVPSDNYTNPELGNFIFPEAGIYFMSMPDIGLYCTSLTLHEYTGFPYVKKLDEKYAPDIKYAGAEFAGGPATYANILTNRRGIRTNLGSTSMAYFDGSADVTPGVSGILPIANGGTGGSTPSGALYNLGAVPTTRKINGKSLSGDITLTAGNIGAVPTTRKINGKSLSGDITLTADDIGIVPSVGLPEVSVDDNDSILMVVNGQWEAVKLPIAEEGEF